MDSILGRYSEGFPLPVIKQVFGVRIEEAGDSDGAWGAASFPAERRVLTLDLTIEYEPGDGFILTYAAREDPSFASDEWFGSLSAAEDAAEKWFGIDPDRWVNH